MQQPVSSEPPRKRRKRRRGRVVDPQAQAQVQEWLGALPRERDQLLEALHLLQDAQGYLSAPHLVALAEEFRLAPAEVYEVATFYHHFDVVKEGEPAPAPLTVRVCDSLTCSLFGAEALASSLEARLGPNVRIQRVPCVGRCARAPVAVVGKNPVEQATPEGVAAVVQSGQVTPVLPEAPTLEQYQASGGYQVYRDCLSGARSVESVLEALEASGLRGLGGAGFPTGRKWRIVRDQPGPRLLAVNIDEGEPGTFKDRYCLETQPHQFLEGVLIACWAVGIDAAYLYLRDEYAACHTLLQRELRALEAHPPGPLPKLHLRRGAGAYVCGEESALIESLEGKRGLPRQRPPYVAEVGLFGRPTLEHNLETLHWVPPLLAPDGSAFPQAGRHGRQGLRAFSLSGRVARPGVYLAPAGITLQELLDEYGGGMAPGHELYGYFPGGASGGLLPASLAQVPLDFGTLQAHGCFIGSAAVVVFSRQDRARDLALNALRFFHHESCGQCTPCRVGTSKAVALMQAPTWDRPLLEELAQVMEDASICGLGQAAPNPIRCVLKYFPEEVQS